MIESQFKKKAKSDLEKQGWKFIELAQDGIIPMGFPDTMCLSPRGHICFIEWKKSKNAKKQPLQEYWYKWLNTRNHHSFFVSPENWEEVREYIVSESGKLPSSIGQ